MMTTASIIVIIIITAFGYFGLSYGRWVNRLYAVLGKRARVTEEITEEDLHSCHKKKK